MSVKTFVDTNIFVYTHDLDARNKHEIAAKTIPQLWEDRPGVLSTQVLQDL